MAQTTLRVADGVLSALGRAAVHGFQSASEFVAAAKVRAAARSTLREDVLSAVSAAEIRMPDFFAVLVAAYVPAVSQTDIDRLPWDSPDPVAGLLSREVSRIADSVELVMRSAGFPLDSSDKVVRRRMAKTWRSALATMHKAVFGNMKLPVFFVFIDGMLDFELTEERQVGFVTEHYGTISGRFYGSKRTL